MKKIRLLTIGSSYIVKSNRAVMNQLGKYGDMEITVVAPKTYLGELRQITADPQEANDRFHLETIPAALTQKVQLFFYRTLAPLILPNRYDLLYCWQEPYIFSGFQICHRATKSKIPFVFRSYQNLDKRYPPPFSYFEKYCQSHCTGWIAGGELVKQTLLKRGYPEQKMAVITLAVDENTFYPNPAKRQAMREKLKLNSPTIAYFGRFVNDKGLGLLREVLETINVPFSFLAVGSGPEEQNLRSWAQQKNIDLTIALAKHEEVCDYYQAADLVVAPSQTMPHWKEQFGRMIVEAFACQKAVITSDSGEIPFVAGDGAIVLAEKDKRSWKQSIEQLLVSTDTREQFAMKGNQRFLDNYSTTRVADQYYKFFHSLVRAHSPQLKAAMIS